MSELFSWPAVTVGMRSPLVNGDPPAPCRGPGAGRFRLQVGTETTVAFRAVHRTRTDPGRYPGLRQGGRPFGSVDVRCPEPGQRIPDVRSISPPRQRTDVGRLVTGSRVRPGRPADRALAGGMCWPRW